MVNKEADLSGGFAEVHSDSKKALEGRLLNQARILTALFAKTSGLSELPELSEYKLEDDPEYKRLQKDIESFPVKIDLTGKEILRRKKRRFAPCIVNPRPSLIKKLIVLRASRVDPDYLRFTDKDRKDGDGEPSVVWMRVAKGSTSSPEEEIVEATASQGMDYYIATGGVPFEKSQIFFLNPDEAIAGQFFVATKAQGRLFFTRANPKRCKDPSFKHLVVLK